MSSMIFTVSEQEWNTLGRPYYTAYRNPLFVISSLVENIVYNSVVVEVGYQIKCTIENEKVILRILLVKSSTVKPTSFSLSRTTTNL